MRLLTWIEPSPWASHRAPGRSCAPSLSAAPGCRSASVSASARGGAWLNHTEQGLNLYKSFTY